ncbi:MAG TPA: GNAT family N-acetyltransferase [Mycobacteriales bacterium]|nr:GNAT family N-acetyltransferase [Mycobacteriales bacterium]
MGARIAADDPRTPDVVALLERHLAFANEHSPPEDVHALDVGALLDPAITFCSARDGAGTLLGVGALKELDLTHGELKSMHTAAAARGRGVGRAMAKHLLRLARERGYERVSLETGTMAAFAPARTLYASLGFTVCPPFADYVESPNSVCMTLALL